MSILAIILPTSLRNLFSNVMVPGTLKRLLQDNLPSFCPKFILYLLESTRTCTVTTNDYFSYKASST